MSRMDRYVNDSENAAKKKRGFVSGLLRFIGALILVVVIALAAMIGFLSLTEYKPADREQLEIAGAGSRTLNPGDIIRVMSWNMGYGALGDNADFFMDGGSSVYTADKERVESNLSGIIDQIKAQNPDIVMLQEIDIDSARSRHINELELMRDELSGCCSSFANNFKVAFLPYPIPPIGKVDSGIATFSGYTAEFADRVQLPIPFSWPVRMANLKRCVLMSRIPVKGSSKELVIFNLHLEAYDDGSGKAAQTAMLSELLKTEADKGNYVIAGGDFNQIFSTVDPSAHPVREGMWQPGAIDVSMIEGDWEFLMDEKVPSCRSLDRAYADADHDDFQYYLIDGFIVSGNIDVKSFEAPDLGFVCSDHNPVVAELVLKK